MSLASDEMCDADDPSQLYQRIDTSGALEQDGDVITASGSESECSCPSIAADGADASADRRRHLASERDEDQRAELSDLDGSGSDARNDSRDQETQTDDVVTPESAAAVGGVSSLARDESADSLQGTKNRINKLKNINDLLKQIDAQFNTVLQQTQNADLSPASSQATNCSETEADRQYGSQLFYRHGNAGEAGDAVSGLTALNGDECSREEGSDSPDTNTDLPLSHTESDQLPAHLSLLPRDDDSRLSPVHGKYNDLSALTPLRHDSTGNKTSTPNDAAAVRAKKTRSAPLSHKFTLTPQRQPFAVSSTSAFDKLAPNKDFYCLTSASPCHSDRTDAEAGERSLLLSDAATPPHLTPPRSHSSPKKPAHDGQNPQTSDVSDSSSSPKARPRNLKYKLHNSDTSQSLVARPSGSGSTLSKQSRRAKHSPSSPHESPPYDASSTGRAALHSSLNEESVRAVPYRGAKSSANRSMPLTNDLSSGTATHQPHSQRLKIKPNIMPKPVLAARNYKERVEQTSEGS